MKDKIEITQADLLKLLVKKINFLTAEYDILHSAYAFEGKSKMKVDPLKVATSHESFLKEKGDIDRLLELYSLFSPEPTTSKKTPASDK